MRGVLPSTTERGLRRLSVWLLRQYCVGWKLMGTLPLLTTATTCSSSSAHSCDCSRSYSWSSHTWVAACFSPVNNKTQMPAISGISNYHPTLKLRTVTWSEKHENLGQKNKQNKTTTKKHSTDKNIWLWTKTPWPVATIIIITTTFDSVSTLTNVTRCLLCTREKLWKIFFSIIILPLDTPGLK